MKRICFDIGSNLFHDFRDGFISEPSQARLYYAGKPCRFDAATTFDSSSREFKNFTDYNELFAGLLKADEIITFNGRIYDLIVLQKLVGDHSMKELLRKPHHDLCGWRDYELKRSISIVLPDMAASFDAVYSERAAELGDSYNESLTPKLANTYRDVKFTYALSEQYLVSGNSEYTFLNDHAAL